MNKIRDKILQRRIWIYINNSIGYQLGDLAKQNKWSEERLFKEIIKYKNDGKLQTKLHPYLFLAILFSLLSCQKEVVSKVTFERKLSGIKPETEFRLDSLRNDKWQKCYIIPPYQQYNSALNRIKLRKHDLNKIKENAISDGINTFVFIITMDQYQ